jgi:lipopolysaccharide transport system ATP-binding protein
MQKLAISVENLAVQFKKRGSLAKGLKANYYSAFKNITFNIYEGEILGILGRNGAGKSTLLKCINGILAPDYGKITNHGNYSISLLSISAGFVKNLTGKENAILSGLLLGIPKKRILDKMSEIEELADIGEFFHEPLRGYSSGMKSRLGFSVAYYLDPDILLIDEVISVGDAQFKKKSFDLMKKRMKAQKTCVIVTHSTNLAETVCDRLIYLPKGKPIVEGSSQQVIEHYQNQS